MQKVLSALLDSTLEGWYGYLSVWQPPGLTGHELCDSCASSPLSHLVDIDSWPHDLGHTLVRCLSSARDQILASLEDLSYDQWMPPADGEEPSIFELAERRDALERQANQLIVSGVNERSAEIRDVLDKCVGPRLGRYLATETESLLKSLEPIEE
jgi:hypothetical protein